ncbi:MAG: bifunctional metallophosphatase/5'-nucleotidase [Anaerolineae bacterium]|nr:bifunctional metallophosphatase/5'-nucleotidase [Anaerolineae bacterium]
MSNRISRRTFLTQIARLAGSAALAGCATRLPSSPPGVHQLNLLYVADYHGALLPRAEDGGERGGAANLVGLVERQRAQSDAPTILLDAGDALQGTFISNSNRGEAMIEIMNLAGVDALALGNHEFDWGVDVLRARIAQARFPCLAANLETEEGTLLEGVQPYAILDLGAFRVGVLGLTYHDLSTIVKASAIEGLRSLPPVESVRRYLPEIEAQADLAIVLSHLGHGGDRALAEAVPEIPLIVGGHSHDVVHGFERVGEMLITCAGAYGAYLGAAQLAFEQGRLDRTASTARLIPVTDAGEPSAKAEAIVARWYAATEQAASQVIGEAAHALRAARGQETALGNLITDAMRAADLGDGVRADIAVHNDGGIRADLDAGPITYAEMYAILPFDNALVGLDMKGAQVREMLENGMESSSSGIQVSGLSFSYSLNKARGRRIVDVTVGGARLDPDRIYRVVTIDYLQTHPQYRLSMGMGTNVMIGGLCLDAVVDYVRAHSPVAPEVEGRITRL